MGETIQKTTWAIDPVHSRIRFDTKYLLITSISGWFREIEGSVVSSGDGFSGSEIQLTIYTNSLFTGIEERDDHLRSEDFFDAKKYPAIYFRSTAVAVKENIISVTGQLSIKNVTQPMSFYAKYLGTVEDPMGNSKACFEMDIVVDRKTFNINWNQFFDKQGILISDEVNLHVDLQLLKLR